MILCIVHGLSDQKRRQHAKHDIEEANAHIAAAHRGTATADIDAGLNLPPYVAGEVSQVGRRCRELRHGSRGRRRETRDIEFSYNKKLNMLLRACGPIPKDVGCGHVAPDLKKMRPSPAGLLYLQ